MAQFSDKPRRDVSDVIRDMLVAADVPLSTMNALSYLVTALTTPQTTDEVLTLCDQYEPLPTTGTNRIVVAIDGKQIAPVLSDRIFMATGSGKEIVVVNGQRYASYRVTFAPQSPSGCRVCSSHQMSLATVALHQALDSWKQRGKHVLLDGQPMVIVAMCEVCQTVQ